GHIAPAVVGPDGSVDLIGLSPGPPLGVGGLPFEATTRDLAEGSLLVLFSDGLVEACGRDIDTGLGLLLRSLEQPPASLEDTCRKVLDTLLPAPPTDDVALLVARTRVLDANHVATRDVPGDPAAVGEIRAWASRRVAEWGMQE